MGPIMEGIIIKSIKCEPMEVIIIDEISNHSVSEQIGVAIKQEPKSNSLRTIEVKSELQDVNDSKPLVIAIKEEGDQKEDTKSQHGHVITSKKVSIKFESLKSEEIEISDEDIEITDEYSNDEERGTKTSNTCNMCGYKSAVRNNLKNHILLHIGEKPYKCNECDYTTSLRDVYNEHLLSHTRQKLYECVLCDFTSVQSADLNEHALRHTGERSFKCTIKSEPDHVKTHHKVKPFKCNKCAYGFWTRNALKKHMFTHSDKKLLECYTCGHKTPSKSHLRQHVRIHFETRVKNYKCNACKTRFLYKSSLLKHMSLRPCKPGHS